MATHAGQKRQRPQSQFSTILRSLLGTEEDGVAPLHSKKTKQMRLIEESKLNRRKTHDSAAIRRDWDTAKQARPESGALDFERKLRKTATRGVVALFNAVQQHQLHQSREALAAEGGAKASKSKALPKSNFLDLLKRGTQPAEDSSGAKAAAAGGWDALREDFMLESKSRLRDFDGEAAEDEDEEEVVMEEELESEEEA